jgi:hypothetical protein
MAQAAKCGTLGCSRVGVLVREERAGPCKSGASDEETGLG